MTKPSIYVGIDLFILVFPLLFKRLLQEVIRKPLRVSSSLGEAYRGPSLKLDTEVFLGPFT